MFLSQLTRYLRFLGGCVNMSSIDMHIFFVSNWWNIQSPLAGCQPRLEL